MGNCLNFLSNKTDEIWRNLCSTAVLACDIDYGQLDFVKWKYSLLAELYGIYALRQDQIIQATIDLLESPWNGWEGKIKFDSLTRNLNMICSRQDIYGNEEQTSKEKKVFVSHASGDIKYVEAFVRLLEGIGLDEKNIFCSSLPKYRIKTDCDIYDAIKEQFDSYDIHMFYMLSKNYYRSAACLNEMGAAWIMQSKYTVLVLPGYNYKKINGAINPHQIMVKFGSQSVQRKEVIFRLNDIKKSLIEELRLSEISDEQWIDRREDFLNIIYGTE